MYSFNKDKGDYEMVDLRGFFEDVRRSAVDTGYELFLVHGINGMKKEFGSKEPVKIANKLIDYYIKYEEYEKCAIIKNRMDELNKILKKYNK